MRAKALDNHGIEYKTIDITESDAVLEWALENAFRARAAPVIVLGEMTTEDFDARTGFRPDKVADLATQMNGGPR